MKGIKLEGDGQMYGKRKILIWLIMITIVATLPILSADASERKMTFKEFLQEVVDGKGNFDGGGASSLGA